MKNKIILIIITCFLYACDKETFVSHPQGIAGQYEIVSSLQNNTRNVVSLEIFFNFSCTHCYKAHKKINKLKPKYGESLVITYRPIIFDSENDAVLRLFHVAKVENKQKLVLEILYAAKFERQLDISSSELIVKLAEELGIREDYINTRNEQWVDDAIDNDSSQATLYKVTGTPTWVVENQLKVKTTSKNLEVVLDNILGYDIRNNT